MHGGRIINGLSINDTFFDAVCLFYENLPAICSNRLVVLSETMTSWGLLLYNVFFKFTYFVLFQIKLQKIFLIACVNNLTTKLKISRFHLGNLVTLQYTNCRLQT